MAHTQDLIVYDADTGDLIMICIVDDDSQLDDPARNLEGTVQLRVPRLDGGGETLAVSAKSLGKAMAELTSNDAVDPVALAADATSLAIAAAAELGVVVQLRAVEVS